MMWAQEAVALLEGLDESKLDEFTDYERDAFEFAKAFLKSNAETLDDELAE